jgi:Zn finger protein HypA/HybF involved in hydrogenase expression
MTQTYTEAYAQPERHIDIAKCKTCKATFRVEVELGRRNTVQCPKCNSQQPFSFK